MVKVFHSEDEALKGYNGRPVTVVGRWQEVCNGFVSHVVEVRFDDGTVFTCWPSEVVTKSA